MICPSFQWRPTAVVLVRIAEGTRLLSPSAIAGRPTGCIEDTGGPEEGWLCWACSLKPGAPRFMQARPKVWPCMLPEAGPALERPASCAALLPAWH